MGKFIVGLIIGIIVIVFMVQNVEQASLTLFFWTVTIPRAIMILIVFVIGIVLGIVIRSIGYSRRKRAHERMAEPEEQNM